MIRLAVRSFCQQHGGWIERRWDYRLKISQGLTSDIYWEMMGPWTKVWTQGKSWSERLKSTNDDCMSGRWNKPGIQMTLRDPVWPFRPASSEISKALAPIVFLRAHFGVRSHCFCNSSTAFFLAHTYLMPWIILVCASSVSSHLTLNLPWSPSLTHPWIPHKDGQLS